MGRRRQPAGPHNVPLIGQTILVVLLLAAPVAAVIVFAVGGVLQVRRRDRLARAAHEAGLLFSAQDPFDIARRYAGFALIGAGHSGRATNVTYGRLDGLPVRAFDFRYEIGHGTRRSARHYAVVVVESPHPLAPFLLWRAQDADMAPLAARAPSGRLGDWDCRGLGAAPAVAKLPPSLAHTATSIQALPATELGQPGQSGTVLLACAPVRRRIPHLIRMEDVTALATALAADHTA